MKMITTGILTWIMYSSLTASVVALIILLIKKILKNYLGAKWHYSIWFLLLLRIVVPFGPKTSFSFFNLYSYALDKLLNNNIIKYGGNVLLQQLSSYERMSQAVQLPMDYSLAINDNLQASAYNTVLIIWLMGVLVITVSMIIYNISFYYKLRGKEYIKHGNILGVVEDCRHRMSLNKKFQIAESNNLSSPILLGNFRPILIFPKNLLNRLDHKDLEYITLHELAHYKRKDILINWITVILQIIHWFNPILWYAFYRMRQDREIACDAHVLSYLTPEEYKVYGLTIINMLERVSFSLSVPQITGFSSSRFHIKNRISMIASFNEELGFMRIKKFVILIALSCIVLTNGENMPNMAWAVESSNIPSDAVYEDLSKYFSGYDGSFVLLNMQKNKYHIYNRNKSQQRVSPLSTFKIITALIGLENGILEDENTELRWNGTDNAFETWNSDHTLASAMRYSVNWYFQEVNQEIGEATMEEKIRGIDYGNKDISAGIRKFWAQSSLKISPIEQVNILKRVYSYDIPFEKKNIDIVKETLKISRSEESILSGKTGTGVTNDRAINGWFIGHIAKGDEEYIFVVNIEGENEANGINARRIALDILKDKGLF